MLMVEMRMESLVYGCFCDRDNVTDSVGTYIDLLLRVSAVVR